MYLLRGCDGRRRNGSGARCVETYGRGSDLRLCHVREKVRSECLRCVSGDANPSRRISAAVRARVLPAKFRNRQAGDPRDVSAAHGSADSRQADTMLRAPRRHDHGHRGRGAICFNFFLPSVCLLRGTLGEKRSPIIRRVPLFFFRSFVINLKSPR